MLSSLARRSSCYNALIHKRQLMIGRLCQSTPVLAGGGRLGKGPVLWPATISCDDIDDLLLMSGTDFLQRSRSFSNSASSVTGTGGGLSHNCRKLFLCPPPIAEERCAIGRSEVTQATYKRFTFAGRSSWQLASKLFVTRKREAESF